MPESSELALPKTQSSLLPHHQGQFLAAALALLPSGSLLLSDVILNAFNRCSHPLAITRRVAKVNCHCQVIRLLRECCNHPSPPSAAFDLFNSLQQTTAARG